MRCVSSMVRCAGLLGGGHDEVADAAPLEFGGAFHDGQRLGGNTSFEARGAVMFPWHHRSSLPNLMYGVMPYNVKIE